MSLSRTWERASATQRWAVVVAIGALVLVAIDIWWVITYRDGFPLNVDEAAYTAIGLIDWIGLENEGVRGWWEAVQSQTPNAPLLPAVTSILHVFKPGIMTGFAALAGFMAILIFAAYGIGERLAGPRLGALAALVTGILPGTIAFSREYVFALPTAAMMACAVFALLRSDGLRQRRWAIACGVALGLMLLSRTMAVAFIPGVLVAASVTMLVRGRGDYRNRFLNMGLLLLSGAAVAATWYWRNLQPVLDYLTNYGYGNQSQYYGAENPLFSWERLSTVAERMIFDDFLVPIAALILVGLLAIAFAAARRVRDSSDRQAELLRLAASDALTVLIIVAAGYAALTSSQNGGNGFTLPLSVLLPSLAVIALRLYRVAVAPVVALLGVIAVANLAATATIWDSVSKPRLVAVPGFGELPWIGGIPRTVGAVRVQVPGSLSHFDDRDRGWTEIDLELAKKLESLGTEGVPPVSAFGSRNRLISGNSVGLAAVLRAHRGIPFAQLNAEPSDSVATYKHQLSAPEFGQPTVLITMSRNTEDFPPLVTQAYAETAARELGFRKVSRFALPDGRKLYVWQRKTALP